MFVQIFTCIFSKETPVTEPEEDGVLDLSACPDRVSESRLRQLGLTIGRLKARQIHHVVSILRNQGEIEPGCDEPTVDFGTLKPTTVLLLEKYVSSIKDSGE